MKKKLGILSLLVFALSFTLCGQELGNKSSLYLIKHVNLVTLSASNEVILDAQVLISDGIIKSINGDFPKGVEAIDAQGKWLIPGLVDAHVHLPTDGYLGPKRPTQVPDISFDPQDLFTPFLATGVTTVWDLNSTMETYAFKKAIEKGYLIGPRIVLSALVNGGQGTGRIANTEEEGRAIVRNAKVEGYDLIKLYSNLTPEVFLAMIDESRKQGIKALGHIPNAFHGKLDQGFVPGFGIVAHAEEFSKHSESFSSGDAANFADLSKRNGTWLIPTLTTMDWIASQTHSLDRLQNLPTLQYMHPLLQSKWLTANTYSRNATPERAAKFDAMLNFHILLIRAFKEAGVPILAGTDAGVSGLVPGFSLHDELELLVQAGLSPEEALRSATQLPAQWLGLDGQMGSIEVGKRADLLLLEANPLLDITHTRKIAGVFVNGRWFDKLRLEAMLTDLADRNTKNKPNFDWNSLGKSKK
jgi:imidazolonepropionase-like amidohydrolase